MFVALGIETAKRMRRIVLSSLACPAVLYCYLSTLAHKRRDFRERSYGALTFWHRSFTFKF